jgi:hypothetical protein
VVIVGPLELSEDRLPLGHKSLLRWARGKALGDLIAARLLRLGLHLPMTGGCHGMRHHEPQRCAGVPNG